MSREQLIHLSPQELQLQEMISSLKFDAPEEDTVYDLRFSSVCEPHLHVLYTLRWSGMGEATFRLMRL